jgi:hypothetical protein
MIRFFFLVAVDLSRLHQVHHAVEPSHIIHYLRLVAMENSLRQEVDLAADRKHTIHYLKHAVGELSFWGQTNHAVEQIFSLLFNGT